jgi:hypothetical protein
VPIDDGRKDSANEGGTDAKLPSLMRDAGSRAVGECTMPLGESWSTPGEHAGERAGEPSVEYQVCELDSSCVAGVPVCGFHLLALHVRLKDCKTQSAMH